MYFCIFVSSQPLHVLIGAFCPFALKVIIDRYVSGSVVKNPPANARDAREVGSVPGSGRSPGEGNRNLLQDSCLENANESDNSATEHSHTYFLPFFCFD